jgi:hypothetical protein
LRVCPLISPPAAPAIESLYAPVKRLNKVMLLEGGGVKVSRAA